MHCTKYNSENIEFSELFLAFYENELCRTLVRRRFVFAKYPHRFSVSRQLADFVSKLNFWLHILPKKCFCCKTSAA